MLRAAWRCSRCFYHQRLSSRDRYREYCRYCSRLLEKLSSLQSFQSQASMRWLTRDKTILNKRGQRQMWPESGRCREGKERLRDAGRTWEKFQGGNSGLPGRHPESIFTVPHPLHSQVGKFTSSTSVLVWTLPFWLVAQPGTPAMVYPQALPWLTPRPGALTLIFGLWMWSS